MQLEKKKSHEGQQVYCYISYLEGALNQPLTTENIDSYASTALEDVIDIVGSVIENYKSIIDDATYGAQTETNAFNHFGLPDIESILDFLSDKSNEIATLDSFIQNATIVPNIIIPPDIMDQSHYPTNGERQPPMQQQRVKTALFILSNEFGVDINDPTQICLYKGQVPPEIQRQQSYFIIDVPALDRALFVCDESENITFVFDTSLYNDTSHSLMNLTKSQIKSYIEENPGSGISISYSQKYVEHLVAAIYDMTLEANSPYGNSPYYLSPPIDGAEHISLKSFAEQHDVHRSTVMRVMEELGIKIYRIKTKGQAAVGICNSDIQKISQHPAVCTPKASHYNARSLEQLHRMYGINKATLEDICNELEIQTGDFKFGKRFAIGKGILSKDAVHLSQHPLLSIPRVGTGLESLSKVAKDNTISIGTLYKVINELEIQTQMARSGKHTAESIALDAIEKIRQHPAIATPSSEDYNAMSLSGLAKKHNVSRQIIQEVIEDLAIQTGDFRFRSKITKGVMPSDAKRIAEDPRINIEEADESILTVKDVLNRLHTTRASLYKAASRNEINLKTYRFGKSTGYGFTADELNILQQDAELAIPNAEDYRAVSIVSVQNILHIGPKAIVQAVEDLDLQLGEYKFTSNTATGFLPTDIERLRKHLGKD